MFYHGQNNYVEQPCQFGGVPKLSKATPNGYETPKMLSY